MFDRVATILEQARANVVRAVNSNMVLAYWLIGREIVQEIQGGGKRADTRLSSRMRQGWNDAAKVQEFCSSRNKILHSSFCKTIRCSS